MAQSPLESTFTPITDSQRVAQKAFKDCDLCILEGPAGTGKTVTAVGLALRWAMRERKRMEAAQLTGRCPRVVLTRPMVECGEKMGFIKGDVDEKIKPWLMPIYDALETMSNVKPDDIIKQFFEFSAIGLMRGRSYNARVVICDEAQNMTYAKLKMLVTRLGNGSKMIISGDTTQADIRDGGLPRLIDYLTGLPGVGIVRMSEEDCVRSPIVRAMLERFKERESKRCN